MAEPAIPVNPNNAATIAITKNVAAQPNIQTSFLFVHKVDVDERPEASCLVSITLWTAKQAKQSDNAHNYPAN